MLGNPIRPVTIASICGLAAPDTMLRLVRDAAAEQPDLILLPENWQNIREETVNSPVIQELLAIARDHQVYILHTTPLRLTGGRLVNAALLINRQGDIAGRYEKAYPYWAEFTDSEETTTRPGNSPQVFQTDFGRLGIAICFDVNFPHVWAGLDQAGAELVVWPSAYAAGAQLTAHVLNHHYPIVSCTAEGCCAVIDLDGRRVLHTDNPAAHIQWVSLDLDRCIYHENFNEDRLYALLERPDCPVEVENHRREEQWYLIRSRAVGVSARATCHAAGMEELRAYKHRSRATIDRMRLQSQMPDDAENEWITCKKENPQ